MRTRIVVLVLSLVALTTSSGTGGSIQRASGAGTEPGKSAAIAAPVADAVNVTTEAQLRAAWGDPLVTLIELDADIVLRDCATGDPIRESPYPVLVDGQGHSMRQTCHETRLLRQDGTGPVALHRIRLSRGGSDGSGGAVTTRGEITIDDSVIESNLSEGPGAGVFSMRKATIRHSRIGGNLANDDGGGVYARRGGVQIYDSVLSHNLVDGSGGAVGSTGDILLVRSYVDGNTTDGDGGALYTDEDGDVVVIGSLVDGSDADGPGGAIFTLDGDVAVLGSTLIGNRADDRGGAISGEADVLIVNSTLARNQAVAHVGGAAWARGNLMVINSTVTDNYAEGEGGGVLAAGTTTLLSSTVSGNIASVAANAGSGAPLVAFGSIIGPAIVTGNTGDTRPTNRSCRVYAAESLGYNFLTDVSCQLDSPTEVRDGDPRLEPLESDPGGFVLRPRDDSPARSRIPSGSCTPPVPDFIPAGHLLEPYVDWNDLLARDAVGTVRDHGRPCDIGAVQSVAGIEARRTEPFSPGPLFDFDANDEDAESTRPDGEATAAAPTATGLVDEGTESTWYPLSSRTRTTTLAEVLRELATTVEQMEAVAARWMELESCLTYLPVDQAGDPRHQWGYRYDERDGTGLDTRTALTMHEGDGSGDLLLPRLDRRPECLSVPVAPDLPRVDAPDDAVESGPHAGLHLTARSLQRRVDRIDERAEDFDRWISCVTWLPVTEAGDDEQDLGFLARDDGGLRHEAAIDIDRSGWDDPDYQLLAFVGPDRPDSTGSCEEEDDDSDESPRSTKRPGDIAAVITELAEDVDDLVEPVAEITTFDECMYTIGVRERPGLEFVDEAGSVGSRPALAFDLGGPELPEHDVLGFPGEEPPQIECDEDDEGVDDD